MSSRAFVSAACATLMLALGGCAESETPGGETGQVATPRSPAPTGTLEPSPKPALVDPRKDGFEVGFGEFAVTLEAEAIRPGPVTFIIRNGGKLVHGFEMESESEDGDSSGPGGGDEDRFKIEKPTFGAGETIRADLDLAPGLYKIYCYVADHEERGMVALLDVRRDAPKVQETAGGNAVAIEGFAFNPPTIEVAAGTEITWRNADPTEHTVTADGESFDSGPLSEGATFSATFNEVGKVTYFCAIHPSMKGSVTVAG